MKFFFFFLIIDFIVSYMKEIALSYMNLEILFLFFLLSYPLAFEIFSTPH